MISTFFKRGDVWLVLMVVVLILIAAACGMGGPACPVGEHLESDTKIEYTMSPGLNLQTGKYDMQFGPKMVTESYCVTD